MIALILTIKIDMLVGKSGNCFMTKTILTITLLAELLCAGCATNSKYQAHDLESIEWCDLWISHANEANLPRVLLIGDSITRAYYSEVEKNLAGKAYVGRLASSAFVSDPILLKQVAMVLDEYHFDVVHFNNGMHGWQHSEAEYAQDLPRLFQTIRQHAPQARLIWANTTPVKVSPSPASEHAGEATDERITERNRIAAEVMKAQGIPIDDLNAPMAGHAEYHSDNVHFNEQGVALQAAQVAAQIGAVLNR
jgi:hypothetical protein